MIKCQPEETYEEVVAPRDAKPMKEVSPYHDDEISEEHDMLESQEPLHHGGFTREEISYHTHSYWGYEYS